ncbi:MAG TPA: RHS repeat-associated core domain-containing protein [Verrucomicrobiae bacterium]|nr:RHS repeat-associated core domain-containing protein [Verrucomicrobiae bacterium]
MKLLLLVGFMLVPVFPLRVAAADSINSITINYADQISSARLFKGPLVWVGQMPPSSTESQELWQAAGLDPSFGVTDKVYSLVTFIQTHPDSAWTPSLEANLAWYFRSEGRYGQALEYWQKAWTVTKDASDSHGRLVADFTIAYWGQLLASLGRVQELDQLMAEVKGRQLSGQEYQRLLSQTRDALAIMKSNPGISYRCGTLALFHVGVALKVKSDFSALADMNSPDTGFSLSRLMELSKEYQLGLAAVKRPAGSELVVPSVVHWRQYHYAAIVAERDGLFNVVDPTFGRPQWMTAAAINEDADGYFMVPAREVPHGWQQVSEGEAVKVYGKGLNTIDPPPPPPPCPGGDPACPVCCPPGGGGGGGSPPNQCSSCGMPTWQVSEPYISVWLHDQPMLYNMSIGRQFVLTLDYHQRETRPVETNAYGLSGSWQVFNFGPNWNCNFLTYLDVQDSSNTNFTNYFATQYCPQGGVRTYSWDGSNPDTLTHTQLQRMTNSLGGFTGFEILYPNGAQSVFGLLAPVSTIPPETLAVITKVIDPQGHVMQYLYATNNNLILLTNIVDFDGRTNRFIYGNTNYPTAVTQVINPYSATVNLTYDTNGVLTNLVDVMGISSSFQYTSTNEVYTYWDTNMDDYYSVTNPVLLLTALKTPYGTTTFDYFDSTAPLFGDVPGSADINRAITVTQPDGGHDLYMYRDDSGQPDTGDNTVNPAFANYPYYYYNEANDYGWSWDFDDIDFPDPYTYASASPIGFAVPLDLSNFDSDANYSVWMQNRNSFFWGPRQYAALSTTNLVDLTTQDYVSARMRNWLHTTDSAGSSVGSTLNTQVAPSPDGTNFGEMTWYAYPGKSEKNVQGTSDWPEYVGVQINNLLAVPVVSSYFGYSGPFGYEADQARMPTAYFEHYEYNPLGFVTNKIITGMDLFGYTEKTNQYIYAANNIDLLQEIGPDGVTNAAYSYDGYHQVLSMTNALGEVTRYTYNTNEQLTSITQPNGLVTTNVYGSDGFLEEQIVTGYSTNSYTYTNGLVYTHTDPRGLTVTNAWDALQRLTKVSYPDGTSVSYVYSNLDLARIIDRMNFTNSFAYDSMRRMTDSTNALGFDTHYEYCTCGELESIRDAAGNLTSFNYDAAGRLTNTTYADGYSVNRAYNFYGQLLNLCDSSGNSVSNYYDDFMHLAAVTNTFGQVAAYLYDTDDRLTNRVDANGVSVGMTYDNLNRLLSRTYPDGGVEHFGYMADVSGPTDYTNQIGNVVTYAYDDLSRKTNEVYVGVTTNRFAYNGAGDLLTLTDGKSQTTTWNYDLYGRVTNKLDANNTNLFAYQYDPDNRLTNRWSVAKGTTIYRYDAVGNLTNVDYSGGTVYTPSLSFAYDALDRSTNMVDGVGTTAYSYDAAGQLLSEAGPWASDTVSYTYANRLRTALSLSQPSGSWSQSYGYDTARRLYSLVSPTGTFGYTYDSVMRQRVDKLTLPDNAYITNAYDSVARMLSTKLLSSSSSVLDSKSYAYNQASQRTGETNTAGDYRNYTYDNEGELKTAIGKESSGTTNRWQEQLGYTYDAAGNLNYRTNNGLFGAFSVNDLNELTTVTNGGQLTVAGTTTTPATNVTVNTSNAVLYADSTFASTNQPWVSGNNTYTAVGKDNYGRVSSNSVTVDLQATNNYSYDLNGNLLSDGTRSFAYDDENQLTAVWLANTWSNSFAYDGKMRRRIERDYSWTGSWTQTNETHFIYDGNVVIQERDANNNPLVTYTRGNDLSGTLQGAGGIGGLLARTDYGQEIPGSPTTAYYHADGNGNITMLIYANQLVAAKYLYDPYGNTLSLSGSLASFNVYRFSSKEWNTSSGLYYYLYRYYDPNLQRWPNRDPLGEPGWSWFILRNQRYYASNFSLNNKIWELNDLLIPNGLDPIRLMHPDLLDGPNEYIIVRDNAINYYDPNGLSCASATAHCATEEAILAATCITSQEIPIAGQIACIALGIDTLVTCHDALEECAPCPNNNSPSKHHRFSRY